MNGGLTYKDMEYRNACVAQVERMKQLLIQAALLITSLDPDQPSGGIVTRIRAELDLQA